jgi:hypothetical protein
MLAALSQYQPEVFPDPIPNPVFHEDITGLEYDTTKSLEGFEMPRFALHKKLITERTRQDQTTIGVPLYLLPVHDTVR